MCFSNDIAQLRNFRKKKRAIAVWKTGRVDEKTGLIVTSYSFDGKDKVVWKLGTVVCPHKIRRPLASESICSAGLYFFPGEPPERMRGDERLIIAKVKPKDIIAVDTCGQTICCVAAKVIEAVNPDQRVRKIEFLTRKIKDAKNSISSTDQQMKEWREEIDDWQETREDQLEGLQNMQDELKKLEATK